jgi:predicted nucleotidyltransferase
MRARPRDFIYTSDDLFFATTSYLHPEDRILAFLRYVPDSQGERSKNGKKYSKVDSEQAYTFLKENYPEYLFDCDNTQVQMMGVPYDRIEKILSPNQRLQEIINSKPSEPLLKKVITIADTFHKDAGIPYESLGISGSILPGLYDTSSSDIDFVVYGLGNHRRAIQTFNKIKDHGAFQSIGDDYWEKIYNKRIKDSTLSFEEFCWYENRKNNRGVVDGTLFDILATREWDEITGIYGDTNYQPHGHVTVECVVSNALAAFDNPAVYEVTGVKVIDGPKVPINNIASFTHTYAGQAVEGEDIIVKGKLEKVMGPEEGYRVVVGTTRESLNEFIKLKTFPGPKKKSEMKK